MARSLDEAVQAFRNRPLDAGPYTFVWLGALVLKCRESGRIRGVACAIGHGRQRRRPPGDPGP